MDVKKPLRISLPGQRKQERPVILLSFRERKIGGRLAGCVFYAKYDEHIEIQLQLQGAHQWVGRLWANAPGLGNGYALASTKVQHTAGQAFRAIINLPYAWDGVQSTLLEQADLDVAQNIAWQTMGKLRVPPQPQNDKLKNKKVTAPPVKRKKRRKPKGAATSSFLLGPVPARKKKKRLSQSPEVSNGQQPPLLGDCKHGIPVEECPQCASWGSSYSSRWDD